jgi:cytochrome c
MKKIFFILTVATFAYACGNQDGAATGGADSSATASTHEEPAAADVTENPDYVKGLELIAQSDCLTCHKVDEKAIGPAYRDVANKYSNDNQTVTMLADKIIKGGAGVWGQIPMTPHPNLSKQDAEQMVKYVLLLKNK